jgi:hypothetical protein
MLLILFERNLMIKGKRNLAKKYFDISDQLKIEANKISKKQQKIDSLENILKSL